MGSATIRAMRSRLGYKDLRVLSAPGSRYAFMRTKQYSANDVAVLNLIGFQKVTGYASPSFLAEHVGVKPIGPRETIRTLEGAKLTRQVLDYERRGLVAVNRASPKRYEISLTDQGRAIALKYRAKTFIPH